MIPVIRLLALGGRTMRIVNPATSIVAVAPVEHGQSEGDRRVQAEVWLSNGMTLWVCESVDEIERLIAPSPFSDQPAVTLPASNFGK